jgi:hypothetical protein
MAVQRPAACLPTAKLGGDWSVFSPDSPVRMRYACSTGMTKTVPAPTPPSSSGRGPYSQDTRSARSPLHARRTGTSCRRKEQRHRMRRSVVSGRCAASSWPTDDQSQRGLPTTLLLSKQSRRQTRRLVKRSATPLSDPLGQASRVHYALAAHGPGDVEREWRLRPRLSDEHVPRHRYGPVVPASPNDRHRGDTIAYDADTEDVVFVETGPTDRCRRREAFGHDGGRPTATYCLMSAHYARESSAWYEVNRKRAVSPSETRFPNLQPEAGDGRLRHKPRRETITELARACEDSEVGP